MTFYFNIISTKHSELEAYLIHKVSYYYIQKKTFTRNHLFPLTNSTSVPEKTSFSTIC